MLLNETGNKQQRHQCYQRRLTKLMPYPVMLVQYFVFQGTTIISIYTLVGPMRNLFPLSDELTLVCFPFCCRGKKVRLLIDIEENIAKSRANRFRYHRLASH